MSESKASGELLRRLHDDLATVAIEAEDLFDLGPRGERPIVTILVRRPWLDSEPGGADVVVTTDQAEAVAAAVRRLEASAAFTFKGRST